MLRLLVVSGPGNAKTETVVSLTDVPGTMLTDTIASEGALLSGSSRADAARTPRAASSDGSGRADASSSKT